MNRSEPLRTEYDSRPLRTKLSELSDASEKPRLLYIVRSTDSCMFAGKETTPFIPVLKFQVFWFLKLALLDVNRSKAPEKFSPSFTLLKEYVARNLCCTIVNNSAP